MADVTKTLKDAAYVAVGLGVIGFQRAQVRRQELRKDLAGRRQELATQVDELGTRLRQLADRVEPAVNELQSRIEPVLDDIEGRLPEQAKAFVQQARQAAKSALGTAPAA